jgi:hypothetical protein
LLTFQRERIEIAAAYNENVNNDSLSLTHIITKEGTWMEVERATTKEMQTILKRH